MPPSPLNRRRYKNPLKNPSTLSHSGLVNKQRAHSEQERVSFKALICGPHAAQQHRTKTSTAVTDLTTHTHTHIYAHRHSEQPSLPRPNMACIWQVRNSVPGGCIYKLRLVWTLLGHSPSQECSGVFSPFAANQLHQSQSSCYSFEFNMSVSPLQFVVVLCKNELAAL